MESEVKARFERIESTLEKVTVRLDGITGRLDRITEAHIELEAAQKNSAILLNRFIEESTKRGAAVDERIANLTILVDQLIKRDFNGN